MFDKNSKPNISTCSMPASPTTIFEAPDGGLIVLAKNGFVYSAGPTGKITSSKNLLCDEDILTFKDYEDMIWISTSKNNIYVITSDLEIKNHFHVNASVNSIAPLEDGSSVVLSCSEDGKNWLEYRKLPSFEIVGTCKLASDLPVISSAAFIYRKKMHFACCSKKGLHLYKETKKGIVHALEHSSPDGDVHFSQLLSRSKRFLIDNMTGLIKTDLRPDKYIRQICFFRNFSAEHGAINQKENWIAFLNPSVLKMIDYSTMQTHKFDTPEKEPSFVKILNHRVVCGYGPNLYIYEFRPNSVRFIMEE